MKNLRWCQSLLLACTLWSGNNQAGILSVSANPDLLARSVLSDNSGLEITAPPVPDARDAVILARGNIQLEHQIPNPVQPIINQGSIPAAAIMPLPNEPTFLPLLQTSGVIHTGDHFDIEVIAFSLMANTSPDELVLGFGFNTQLDGTGAAQFLGSSINPAFTDLSNQEGVNLAAAGLAFPALSSIELEPVISLAVLHFQAVTAGDLNIAISSDLNDPNQGLIFLNQAPLAIQASYSLAITSVPLPSGLLLFGTGLAMGLSAFRQRKA